MSSAKPLVRRFKVSDPREDQRKSDESRSSNNKKSSFSLLKEGIFSYKFKEGKNLMRFLPQWEDSPYDWNVKLNVLSFFEQDSALRGYFRIMDNTKEGLLSKVRRLIQEHPEFKNELRTPEKPHGISLYPRPRVAFLGFEIAQPELKVQPIILPGTLDFPTKDGKKRPSQAGTRIIEFCRDEDIHGSPRFGNIYDPATGRVICIDVYNTGTDRVRYDLAVDDIYSIEKPQFESVHEQIHNWDHYLYEPSNLELVSLLKAYLPSNIWDYVTSHLNLDSILDSIPPSESASHVGTATASVADIPLPSEEEEHEEPVVVSKETPKEAPAKVATPAKTETAPAKSEPEAPVNATNRDEVNARIEQLRSQIRDKKPAANATA